MKGKYIHGGFSIILQVKDAWKDPSEPAEKTQGSFIGTLNIDDP